MADELIITPIMMHKINPSVDYNEGLKRLDNLLNKPTNQSQIKTGMIYDSPL